MQDVFVIEVECGVVDHVPDWNATKRVRAERGPVDVEDVRVAISNAADEIEERILSGQARWFQINGWWEES